jgi:mannobiose 2-epimerase
LNRINIEKYYNEVEEELKSNILPFWDRTIDKEKGGFHGRILNNEKIVKDAPRSAILYTRLLWAYSAVYFKFKEEKYLKLAKRAYKYIQEHFRDEENGGIFWLLDSEGNPIEYKKQIYSQAFCIFALSEYYKITKKEDALNWAIEIFHLIEENSYDSEYPGYFEAYDKEWNILEDVRLSEKDKNERKTMNTHLHLLEGYTNLMRIWEDKKLKQQLEQLIRIFLDRIIDPKTGHFNLFFDDYWNLRSSYFSYGHDIEGSWLLHEAGKELCNSSLLELLKSASIRLADITLMEGIDEDGGLMNEGDNHGVNDTDKHWWPQAESMVGFLNAYQITKETRFYDASYNCWEFVKENIIDRKNGEWFFRVNKEGKPYYSEENKVGPWKAPYHNIRACLEIMRRLENL